MANGMRKPATNISLARFDADIDDEIDDPVFTKQRSTSLDTFSIPAIGDSDNNFDCNFIVVRTEWHGKFIAPVADAVSKVFECAGVPYEVVTAPGASDLIATARLMLRRKPSAVVCLGLMLPGSGDGYNAFGFSILQGLARLNAQQSVPVISGVLMCRDEAQAMERTHGTSNPGTALAETALYMAKLAFTFEESGDGISRFEDTCGGHGERVSLVEAL